MESADKCIMYTEVSKGDWMKLTSGIVLLMFSLNCISQSTDTELITDRPDQTESAAVVPKHTLQVETGFIREGEESAEVERSLLTYNTTLLRFGLSEHLELRLGSEYAEERVEIQDPVSQEVLRGLGPLYAGMKVAISEERGCIPRIAIVGGLIFQQVAGEDFRHPYTSVDLRFAFSHTLTNKFSLGYNLGLEYDGETTTPGIFYSVAFGAGITGGLGMFIESYGVVHTPGGAEHLFDAGLTYLLLPNIQLDISGGFGINDPAMDKMVSCGLSFRIPR